MCKMEKWVLSCKLYMIYIYHKDVMWKYSFLKHSHVAVDTKNQLN